MMDITANMLKSACSVPSSVLSALHVLILYNLYSNPMKLLLLSSISDE